MQTFLKKQEIFLRKPLNLWSRLCLIAAAACIGASFLFPLWEIRLVAPQYRDGLELYIYAYQLQAGNDGQHLDEINLLNHYIGMQPIREADFVEMTWIPFAFGIFILLCLRAVVFGRMGNVVDLFVLFAYFGLFSMGNFYYRLYTYGQNLDPRAPMTIEPFTPVLFGTNRIANFTQYSYPDTGSYFLIAFGALLVVAAILSLREKPIDPYETR